MTQRVLFSLLAVLSLAGCGAGRQALTPGPELKLVNAAELPPPVGVTPGAGTRSFRVGAFDKLSVNVYGLPEVSQTVQVDAAGRIALPLVGALEAAGRTPEEISALVSQRLRDRYVRDPQVAVNVDETASQTITIDGQVAEPGIYPVVGRLTLVRAVASAKGATEFAKLREVVVFRTVGDQRMVALYDLDAIRRGEYRDPEVYADDVIVVGDSPARRRFRDFLQVSPLLVGPLIAILQNNGA